MIRRDPPAYPDLDRFDRLSNAAVAVLKVARGDAVQRALLVPASIDLIERLSEELREIERLNPTSWIWASNRVPGSPFNMRWSPRRM